jgi:hypothetical protein
MVRQPHNSGWLANLDQERAGVELSLDKLVTGVAEMLAKGDRDTTILMGQMAHNLHSQPHTTLALLVAAALLRMAKGVPPP